MSKSKGNVYYLDTLRHQGYDLSEIRFFLIYGHYRKRLNYSLKTMKRAVEKLRDLKELVRALQSRASGGRDINQRAFEKTRGIFIEKMDNDLDVEGAFDDLQRFLSAPENSNLNPSAAKGILQALAKIDKVLGIIF